jgi:hypothetical protein
MLGKLPSNLETLSKPYLVLKKTSAIHVGSLIKEGRGDSCNLS